MKIIAFISIVAGALFTAGMIYIFFTVESSFDLILGWFFFGPVPLLIGILLLKKNKYNPLQDFLKKK